MLEANAPPAKPNERATARVGDHAALLRTSLRQVRHRAFVILNPHQIARLDKAAANLATEKMIDQPHARAACRRARQGPPRALGSSIGMIAVIWPPLKNSLSRAVLNRQQRPMGR
jgi:hypothetical protein